ncbi:MAG: cytochrome c biogenesis CcdA family protein [Candidatus Omnitrophica bacterium]|nr:cytochrome c biogenesis CcdA family protein [Candidatus Omnitrophota bacterium]
MDNVTLWGIFVLGIITSISPCSLALLVAALSFIVAEEKNFKEGALISIAFTLGMSLIFFVLGVFISKLGQFVRFAHLFYTIAGILLVLFGLAQLGAYKKIKIGDFIKDNATNPKKLNFVQQLGFSVLSLKGYSKIIPAFLLGILFALGWAPCAASLLMPITLLIMSQQISIWQGGGLLFIFGLGHGIPIIPLAVLSGQMRAQVTKKFTKVGEYLTKLFGVIILVIGVLFIIYGPKINMIFRGK